ncbi:MAG: hypothetical protein NT031_11895, partial [Planctomycetota bacterium]|nr:hypothetical protein [Planctomycetota bacterium]
MEHPAATRIAAASTADTKTGDLFILVPSYRTGLHDDLASLGEAFDLSVPDPQYSVGLIDEAMIVRGTDNCHAAFLVEFLENIVDFRSRA